MTRLLVPLLIGLLATGGSALSAFIAQEPLPDTPDPAAVAVDNAMVYGEWLALLLGGVAGLLYLWRRPHRARGMLAVGLYAVMVGIACIMVSYVWWIPGEDTSMILQLPGGLAVVVGALLAAAGAARLAGAPTVPALGVGLATPIGLLVVGAVVARAANLPSPSAVVLACALGSAALLAAGVRWTEVVLRPLVLAGAGAALTVAVLLARGPGDWDMHTSHTLRLYGLPLVALGVALSVAILDLTDRAGTAMPRRGARAG